MNMVHDNIIYAIVNGEDIVEIIICETKETADEIAKGINENCFAVLCQDYMITVGDIYKDGKFYNGHTGDEIECSNVEGKLESMRKKLVTEVNNIIEEKAEKLKEAISEKTEEDKTSSEDMKNTLDNFNKEIEIIKEAIMDLSNYISDLYESKEAE